MKLQPAQKTWLDKLDAKASAQTKLQAREDQKLAVMTKLFRDRESKEKELYTGTAQTVIQEKTGKTQQTQNFVTRDQRKLFDMDEQRQGFVLAEVVTDELGEESLETGAFNPETGEAGDQKNFQKMQKAGRIVDSLARQMEEEVDELDEDGNPVTYQEDTPTGKVTKNKKVPLFSPGEIKEELYTPLVRRGLVPETNVPDKFSATKEMLDGSFAAYGKRLSVEKKKGMFSENLGLGIAVFRGAVSFSGAVQGLNAASSLAQSQLQWTPSTSDGLHGLHQALGVEQNDAGAVEEFATNADKAAQGMVYAANLSDLAFDIGKEGGEAIQESVQDSTAKGKELAAKKAEKQAAGKVGGLAVAEISTALGSALNNYGLGISASSAFGALVPGPKVAEEIEEKKIAKAGALLWTAFSTTLAKLDPKTGTSTVDINKAIAKAKSAFDSALKPADIVKSLESKAYEKAASQLAAAGVAAVQEIDGDLGFSRVFNEAGNVDLAQANAGKVVSEEFERDTTPKPKKEQIERHPKDHAAQWLQTPEGFICMKCEEGKKDPELFAGILERKIAELERDAAIWKWITTVGGLGFDLAADFVAPLAIGGALLRMAKNVNEAMKRYSDFNAFIATQQTMLRAASAFSAPLSQFVSNSGKQFTHYSANAAMEGMKVIAAVLQLGYVTAPVGVGLAGGTAIAQAIEGVLYEAKKRWDLETAWQTYKKALENPDNRKTGLTAVKSNPTLAKFSVAWGAVIKKDPLVVDFMRQCDLNADTLKDPEANVTLVVTYLEKRMPDDNVVVGRDYSAPNKVDLTAEAWLKEKSRAEKKLKVTPQGTQTLEYLLTQWSTDYPLLKSAKVKDPELIAKCLKTLSQVDIELQKYKALDAEGHRIHEVLDMKMKFSNQTTSFTKEVETWKT